MTTDEDRPTLNFFRATPRDMLAQVPLASSLQSFETCLFLIGLELFPSALVSCATAWESALKAKLAIGPQERGIKLEKMLMDIRSSSEALFIYDDSKIDAFRLRFVRDIYLLAGKAGGLDPIHCFSPFRHFIRLGLKETAKTESEWELMERAHTQGKV